MLVEPPSKLPVPPVDVNCCRTATQQPLLQELRYPFKETRRILTCLIWEGTVRYKVVYFYLNMKKEKITKDREVA